MSFWKALNAGRKLESVKENCGETEIYKWGWAMASNFWGSFIVHYTGNLLHYLGKWVNHISERRVRLGALCDVPKTEFILLCLHSSLDFWGWGIGKEREGCVETLTYWKMFLNVMLTSLFPSKTLWKTKQNKNHILHLCYLLMRTNEIRAKYWLKSSWFGILIMAFKLL